MNILSLLIFTCTRRNKKANVCVQFASWLKYQRWKMYTLSCLSVLSSRTWVIPTFRILSWNIPHTLTWVIPAFRILLDWILLSWNIPHSLADLEIRTLSSVGLLQKVILHARLSTSAWNYTCDKRVIGIVIIVSRTRYAAWNLWPDWQVEKRRT